MDLRFSTAGTKNSLEPDGITAVGAAAASVDKSEAEFVSPPKPIWTFLTNHAHVLLCIAHQPEARMRDVAQLVGVTERCVQRILADLENAGYVSHVHRGRCNHYEVHADLPLRHPAEQHRQVSALLKLVLGARDPDSEVET